MPSCRLRLRPSVISDDYLSWRRIEVHGRRAEYGLAGPEGPAVVFLHGFALGSHAYKRPLRRLARRGCRVYAPAMPGFGATAPLEPAEEDLAGYAEWVADFMKEVEIEGPVVLIGHSFGGAVATKLAHTRPDLVSHVVLLNAVGGVSPRPLRDWITGFAREFSSVRDTAEMAVAARDDILTNLWRNPLALMRVATVARNADVRQELSGLGALGVPSLVLTSEGDSVIPLRCFEAVCEFLGTRGQVVTGKHSWLLTDPDSFGDVLGSVVDVEVAQHQRRRAISQAGEVATLLGQTRIPASTIATLLEGAPPLWLTSEPTEVLAGDLALCHPPLRDGEVRAVARPGENETMRLSVVATDRPGLLAGSAAVLARQRLDISEASATTWPLLGLALHSFVVAARHPMSEDEWKDLCEGLRRLSPESGEPDGLFTIARGRGHPTKVECFGVGDDMSVVRVFTDDQVGLLAGICRWFADHQVSIQALHARTQGRRADDTFLVTGAVDAADLKRDLELA